MNQIKERCIYCGSDVYYDGSEKLIKCGMCGHTLIVAKFENELARMNAALEEGTQAKAALAKAEQEKKAADDRLFAALSDLGAIRDDQDTLGKLLHALSQGQADAAGRLKMLQQVSSALLNAQDNIFARMNVLQEIGAQLQSLDMNDQAREALMNDFMNWSQQAHEDDTRRLSGIASDTAALLQAQAALAQKMEMLRASAQRHQQAIDAFRNEYAGDKLQKLRMLMRQAENDQHDWLFDKAGEMYQKVLIAGGEDAEIYWRRLLCHYCVSYQQDDEGTMIPIILNPDLSDPEDMSLRKDLARAAEKTSSAQAEVYTQELAGIDRILDKYREVRHQVDYDVFISVKQSKAGRYTKDSDVASSLYDFLREKNLKVFNSRRTTIPAGQEYEPYIIAALMSAKVLIVVGSSAQNMTAQWVRNEWSRFQWLQKNEKKQTGSTNRKLFCYLTGSMRPGQIPKALNPDKQAIVDGVMAHDQLIEALSELTSNVTFHGSSGDVNTGTRTESGQETETAAQVTDQLTVWLTLGMYDRVKERYRELTESGKFLGEIKVHLAYLCAKYQVEDFGQLAETEADLSKEAVFKAAKRVCRTDEEQRLLREILEKNKTHITGRTRKEKPKTRQKGAQTKPLSDGPEQWTALGGAAEAKGDDKEAFLQYKKAAQEAYPPAMMKMADCLAAGRGTRKNRVQALVWYQKAADAGEFSAWRIMAEYYEKGIGTAKDHEKAVACYEMAAKSGDVDAAWTCGLNLLAGVGVPKDETKAFHYFENAGEQGHKMAQLKAAQMCEEGIGTRKSRPKAMKWYEMAAAQGDISAMGHLGRLMLQGKPSVEDAAEAVKWLNKAAEKMDKDALFALGECCEQGVGMPKNQEKAAAWFRKAAKKGHVEARFRMGQFYEKGEVYKQNLSEAFIWYRQASGNNHPEALNKMGRFYEYGLGGQRKDKTIATVYYKRAMEAGNSEGRLNYERITRKKFLGLF